jgi:uncharacterized protein YchJ
MLLRFAKIIVNVAKAILKESKAPTAEKIDAFRYSAYVRQESSYLVATILLKGIPF